MDPKMTAKDAAEFLGISVRQLCKTLQEEQWPCDKTQSCYYFGYNTARSVFNLSLKPRTTAFQIVKGGTGKTSLALSFAVRANLYGLKVLCIDLDQQGNLTQSFDVDAEQVPVMIDILAEGYPLEEAIVNVYPGMDVLASRIENALIDDVIKLKGLGLDAVYRTPIDALKQKYDLIVVDCPPNLGQSVAAVTLAVDTVVAPVVPENFALSGLRATCTTVKELEMAYERDINLSIVLNKFDARTVLSQEALTTLAKHRIYKNNLLNTFVRNTQDFPNAIAAGHSIYDTVKPTQAKRDIDCLTRELLGIGEIQSQQGLNRWSRRSKRLEESLA